MIFCLGDLKVLWAGCVHLCVRLCMYIRVTHVTLIKNVLTYLLTIILIPQGAVTWVITCNKSPEQGNIVKSSQGNIWKSLQRSVIEKSVQLMSLPCCLRVILQSSIFKLFTYIIMYIFYPYCPLIVHASYVNKVNILIITSYIRNENILTDDTCVCIQTLYASETNNFSLLKKKGKHEL
jgi:hypothetical protein